MFVKPVRVECKGTPVGRSPNGHHTWSRLGVDCEKDWQRGKTRTPLWGVQVRRTVSVQVGSIPTHSTICVNLLMDVKSMLRRMLVNRFTQSIGVTAGAQGSDEGQGE